MNAYRIFSLLFIILILGIGHSSQKYSFAENLQPLNNNCISIPPPPGTNWFKKGENNDVIYVKEIKSKTHSAYIKVSVFSFEDIFKTPTEFLQVVKKRKEFNEKPQRFQNTYSKCELDDRFGPFSVKYYQRVEDHGSVNEQVDFLILENFGFVIIHPNSSSTAIEVYYSERFKQGEESIQFRKEWEQFINGLKFP